jgi:hypothetical protein
MPLACSGDKALAVFAIKNEANKTRGNKNLFNIKTRLVLLARDPALLAELKTGAATQQPQPTEALYFFTGSSGLAALPSM